MCIMVKTIFNVNKIIKTFRIDDLLVKFKWFMWLMLYGKGTMGTLRSIVTPPMTTKTLDIIPEITWST